MQITRKAEVDKVIGAYKLLLKRNRKDIVRSQEAAATAALKEREAAKPPTP